MESCNARRVPFLHGLSSFALSSPFLSHSQVPFSLSPSAFAPLYFSLSLPRIVSTMIHWIPLTFFTTATPKGMHTYAVHTVIRGTRYTGSSGVFRTFEFFPRVKSSIFSLFLLSRVSPPVARLSPSVPVFRRRPRKGSDDRHRMRYIA